MLLKLPTKSIISILAIFVLVASTGFQQAVATTQEEAEPSKAILITGASSGLGRMIAESLAAKGYRVYAGARKQEDLDALNAISNIEAVRLDVTIQSEIDAAVEWVKKQGGLYAIVNNAGVGMMGPLIELEEKDLDFVLGVNVYGPFRITKAFAPLLIESKGRVVNIGSISGWQTRAFYGAYSMSKHAIEAYSDALTLELDKFDVNVSIIDPGGFRSNIGMNIHKRLIEEGMHFDDSLYKEDLKDNWALAGGDLSTFKDPDDVVVKVEHALFADNPQRRYMVVNDADLANNTMRAIIEHMVELNYDQPFSYDRDGLIKLLDEELAKKNESPGN
ncbi:MAG: SDR family oxidoreductase [Gammaproteobacteria bacterium]|nr:SDR family oxidoreductase [Gammaproteobacteria bacterium]